MDYATLQEIAKHNVCADCHGTLEIAWKDGKYQFRCSCGYWDEPGPLERIKGAYEKVRTGEPVGDYIIRKNILRVMRQNRDMKELKRELEKERGK